MQHVHKAEEVTISCRLLSIIVNYLMIFTYLMTFFFVLERKSLTNCFNEHENDDFLFGIHSRTFYEDF